MLFGAPKERSEVFANLGFTTPSQPVTVAPTIEPEAPPVVVDTVRDGWQQLTTRPVAGFITIAGENPSIRYAEQGTGHIYEINLDTGEEELISRTTTARVRQAIFSEDGRAVALTAINGYVTDTIVGIIDKTSNSIDGTTLPPDSGNVSFIDSDTVQYTRTTSNGTTAYVYKYNEGSQSVMFSVPFSDVRVLWHQGGNYVVHKPADGLKSYLYKINQGSYESTPVTGYSMVPMVHDNFVAYQHSVEGTVVNELYDTQTGIKTSLATNIVPEKCVAGNFENNLWCAAEIGDPNLTEWYQGAHINSDYLWEISLNDGVSTLLSSSEQELGRGIDVSDIQTNTTEEKLFFRNRIDNTLWQYTL